MSVSILESKAGKEIVNKNVFGFVSKFGISTFNVKVYDLIELCLFNL